MNILIIGNGGREHVLAWKINKSPLVSKIWCAPGNGGTSKIAENVPIKPDQIDELLIFAEKKKIDLTVVGPELPLTLGIADTFIQRGLKIFGVTKKAAELEGSKVFAKTFFKKHAIPTAQYEVFDNQENAQKYIQLKKTPLVVKVDGLAAGKGVFMCKNPDAASAAVRSIMNNKAFGQAGKKIIIEEFLNGEEVSFIVITDGKNIVPLVPAQDHKTIGEGDTGPNTGGMGAYSPAPIITKQMSEEIIDTIIRPTIDGMAKEGRRLQGVLYAGLMIDDYGPKILEYNVRFGDPETQPILLRMKNDIVPLLMGAGESTLDTIDMQWKEEAATCVVMASQGYPGSYEKGKEIQGLETLENTDSCIAFHAGTRVDNGKVLTDGGRVLGITALGSGIKESIEHAYQAVSKISFKGAYYRTDIGRKRLFNLKGKQG